LAEADAILAACANAGIVCGAYPLRRTKQDVDGRDDPPKRK
jgi:hypothetical protein